MSWINQQKPIVRPLSAKNPFFPMAKAALSEMSKEQLVAYITDHSDEAIASELTRLNKGHIYLLAKAVKTQLNMVKLLPANWHKLRKHELINLASQKLSLNQREFDGMTIAELQHALRMWAQMHRRNMGNTLASSCAKSVGSR